MIEQTHHQVALTTPQVPAMLQAANDAEADSLLVRVEKGSGPGLVEAWLLSEQAEGFVGMIEIGAAETSPSSTSSPGSTRDVRKRRDSRSGHLQTSANSQAIYRTASRGSELCVEELRRSLAH